MTRFLSILFCIFIFYSSAYAETTLLNFDESGSSGTTWIGWTWTCTLVSYDRCGWYNDQYEFINNTRLPRNYEKTDYDNRSDGSIDTSNRAPSTSAGASLLIADNGTGTKYQPSWWFTWPRGMEYVGLATASNDRLSMYVKLEGYEPYTDPNTVGVVFEMGTYTCWDDGGYGGEDCPVESGNGHWYHQTQIQVGTWVHVLWDKHPTHRRSVSSFPPDNPTLVEYGKDYFSNLFQIYLQFGTNVSTADSSRFWVDEMKFTSASELGEAAQNDNSITNIWVGYWSSDQHWEIGWSDLSSDVNHDSEFEIRWSTVPITNSNWSSATIVTPLDFVVNTNHVHKSNTWKSALWTRFILPPTTVSNNSKIYFAVKDVSVLGGLYQASPSSSIHTIDYALSVSTPPTSPGTHFGPGGSISFGTGGGGSLGGVE